MTNRSRHRVAWLCAASLAISAALAGCDIGTATDSVGPSASATPAAPLGTAALVRVGTFTATGAMATRYFHTSTVLKDGRVLITGGCCSDPQAGAPVPLATTELYDPRTGTATPGASMLTGRMYHVATLLNDGRVLISGGTNQNGSLASIELYDPGANKFTAGTPMSIARYNQTTTVLQDGRVLVTGGATGLSSAELYAPATGKWTVAGVNPAPPSSTPSPGRTASPKPSGWMLSWRSGHTATLLPDGRVLIIGGQMLPQSADLYDPTLDRFTKAAYTNVDRFNHTATLLNDGRVLIVGGYTEPGSAELYDYKTGEFTPTGSLLGSRTNHTATLLPDGRVLLACGLPSDDFAEVYNPKTGTFNRTNPLVTPRTSCSAALLQDGSVLLDGGIGVYGATQIAELYKV